jgi:two-component system sensor histidine kinase RegB
MTFPDAQTLPTHDPRMRLVINPGWLVKLRWAAVIGQLVTIAIVRRGFGISLPNQALLGLIALTAVTNTLFHYWCTRIGRQPLVSEPAWRVEAILGSLLLLDLGSLTGLLYFSGGIDNPFHLFYLVNLALSAVLLRPVWAWTLTVLATTWILLLIPFQYPFPVDDDAVFVSAFGTWTGHNIVRLAQPVAVTTAAVVITYFVTRLTREQARLEQELRIIDQRRARSEKLEALGALAGGAAHELASPLSTIAVVVKELDRRVNNDASQAGLREDLHLIREEVDRCRKILDRMAAQAGEISGEAVTLCSPDEILEDILSGLRLRARVTKTLGPGTDSAQLRMPRTGLAQALRGIVQNALDASPSGQHVELAAEIVGKRLRLVCRDHGPGMPAEVLARAGEPFFTTKGVGRGMGLGLFLARSVIERLGGTLDLSSSADPTDPGATVTIHLPLA